jgi:hypothetical protein
MFVGRDRELSLLTAGLSRARSGSGGVALVAGEPGIGKTRLAAEAAAIAREKNVRAVWGRCWEAGGAPAYWPWREALDAFGVAFPDRAAIAANDPAAARFALFRAVASELGREAAREPLLIVLEDLHAADRATLLLLEFLAGSLRTMPAFVIGTYRDLEASLQPEIGDALARVGRTADVLALARLDAPNVAAIVRAELARADEALAAKLYDITHGNPLFVDEMVREVRARGAGEALPIPLGVREIIRQRLALVSGDARAVLDVASVLGVEVSEPVLARMVGDAAALDDVVRSGLVTARGARLRFSHALYREALYHELPRARRWAIHRDAARALSKIGAPLAEIAHHWLESGPEAATDAIEAAVRAAEQAVSIFAFEEATAILDRAQAAIPDGVATLRARVLIARAEARIRSGDATGRELCIEAARIARDLGDASLLALAGLAYGCVLVTLAVDPIMVGMLDEALAQMPPGDLALRARTMARLAAARQPSLATVQIDLDLALEAVAMARRLADRRELIGVIHSASGALYGFAEPNVRVPIMREMEQLAEELGDTTRLLHARVRLAVDYLELGDFASYEQLASAYEKVAERVGPAAEPWRVPLMRSTLAIRDGAFAESLRLQEASRTLDAESPRARRAQAFHRIGFLRASERHAELRANIPELRSLWLAMPFGAVLVDARVASIFAWIGATDEARLLLSRAPDSMFGNTLNAQYFGEAMWLTGEARHAENMRAHIAPSRARNMMYWFDCEIVEAPVTRIIAYLSALIGDWDECDRSFDHALRAVESSGRRGLAARMRFELGDLFVRRDREIDRARALLVEARAGASELALGELVALIDARHPTLAKRSSVAPPRTFALALEGEYYAIATASGTLRFKASRGMHYLARLVDQQGVDVHVLELVGSTDADRGDAGELIDPQAFRSYRARLEKLRSAVEDAEARGDVDGAERARDEMEAIATEIGRGTKRGGRAKRADSAVDRARTAVQRRIKDAIDRVAEQDAELGGWLRRVVRTGNFCSFRPRD